eukprot:13055880-Alexandrium_andersonii.AAC.1
MQGTPALRGRRKQADTRPHREAVAFQPSEDEAAAAATGQTMERSSKNSACRSRKLRGLWA